MDNIVKIPSVQSTFSATKNLVDFDIPNHGVYDLTKSYVNVNVSVDNTSANSVSGNDGIFNSYLNVADNLGAGQFLHYPNVALVKNAHFHSQTRGSVCDIRRLDTLKSTLYHYTKDRVQQKDNSYIELNSVQEAERWSLSPFREYQVLSTSLTDLKSSRRIVRDMRIPLGDVFDIAKSVDAWSGSTYGQSRVHLEMNFDKLRVDTSLGQDNVFWALNDGDAVNNASSYGAMNDGGAGATGEVTTIQTTMAYIEPEQQSPFYVGQDLRISFSIGAGAQAPVIRQITNITRGTTGAGALNGQLLLTLNASIVTLNNDQITGVSVTGINPDTATVNINAMELVLQSSENPRPPSKINYTCYTTEIDNANNLTTHTKNYMCEPNATNLFIMFPNDIVSRKDDLTSYRFVINNEQQTNRAINDKEPLHYDNLIRTFQNAEMPLKSLREVASSSERTAPNEFNAEINLVPQPLPLTQNQKIVGVNLVAGTGFNTLHLYKQVQRTI
tara:strand:+ start:1035 stop:2531 length:1497 start_codon:yes stop_codon:yes gene_type:complete